MVVLDTDKITVNEAIPYITGWNQGIDEIKNIFHKSICQFFVFLVNQNKYDPACSIFKKTISTNTRRRLAFIISKS